MVHRSKQITIKNRGQNKFNYGDQMKLVCIKMRYSIKPKDRIYVKGYGFLSFAKNIGKYSNKYSQKLLDSAKKSTTDAIKTASKKEI